MSMSEHRQCRLHPYAAMGDPCERSGRKACAAADIERNGHRQLALQMTRQRGNHMRVDRRAMGGIARC